MCVCCRELRAQRRKSGVLLLRASIVYQKTSKKRKKKGKKRENFSPTKTREEEKTRGLVFVKSLDWKKILSFFLSSGRKPLRETTKEKKTHLNARRIKRREERERETGREREDLLGGEENQSEMDSDKQDGIQKLLRAEQEANAIVTAARQGGSRCSRPFARSFFFLVLGGGGRRTPGARFVRFLLGLFSMRRINLSTHTRSSSLFVWRRQKKRRESNKPKTKRRPRSNCTEINESNATSKWWRKPPVVPMK